MLKVGLTGGIGTGKTTVAKIFETLGIPVYYADDAARRLMNTHKEIREKIIQHFGAESYNFEGLDRKYIASIVFNEPVKLELLNSITHPVTISDADEWMQKQSSPYVIKEAALLYESKAYEHVDLVVGVYATLPIRIKRVMLRDQAKAEEVTKRINRQMEEEEKRKRYDFEINNNGEALVIPQVLEIHEQLLRQSAVSS